VRSRLLLALAVLGLVAGLGCGDDGDGGGGQARTLDVGLSFSPGVDDAADRVAFERLRSEKEIRARFTETGGPPNTAAALARGDIDMGSTSLLSAITAIDQGADLRVVLGAAMAVDFSLVARGGIDDVRDLEGKRVAYGEPGGSTEVVTKVALKRAGLAEGDVKLSVVDDAQRRAAALAAGKVDAIALEFPDIQLLKAKEGDLRTVASLYEIAPFLMADVFVVRGDFADKNADLVGDVVSGLLDGYEFVRSPAGRRAWLTQATKYAGKEEASVVNAVYDRQRQTGYWPRKDEPLTAERYGQAVRFWREADLLDSEAPFEKVWQISFWRKAVGG
jgi:ABC-type nitrate/sulfonate/bicarbonate transport system substrate-binding protein